MPLAGLKLGQLHSALLVLIQHNYVNCYLQSEDANPRRPPISIPLYEVDLPAILQSLRQGSFFLSCEFPDSMTATYTAPQDATCLKAGMLC